MRLAAVAVSVVALGVGVSVAAARPLPGTSCATFPADNPWNVPVDKLPVESDSATIINSIGASKGLHADFGAGLWQGQPIGIPYNAGVGVFDWVQLADTSDPSNADPVYGVNMTQKLSGAAAIALSVDNNANLNLVALHEAYNPW